MVSIEVTVNGRARRADVEPRLLLIHLLRDVLGVTGPHVGCVVGRCGACTVVWNGKPVKSCMVFAVQTDGGEVLTVEGLAGERGLHPIQEAFWSADAAECGYCTPGMVMSAYGLLSHNPAPSTEEIKAAISGNICRCTGYTNIVRAIHDAAERMQPAFLASTERADVP
ncbi:MAG: (2Fe-2S)-binding protein [Chloroflexi bacterium]|nr:(2Fe-2S)-binding protein [Chloroflexota bacterium]